MRTLLILLGVILFIGNTKVEAQTKVYPEWYKNRELHSEAKFEIIGYGQGLTIGEAQANAKENIALTMFSKVDSSFTSVSTDYKQRNEATLKITSKLDLQNLKTLKQEYKDGTFYIALMYKNLDLAYRIKTSIDNIQCSDKEINSYLKQTLLYKSIRLSIGCELDVKLDRRNKAWYLKYKGHLFLLNSDEFEELFVNTNNDSFKFNSNKNVLTDGDSFYFTFNSKEDGYITLLNVYENGIVTLLQASKFIKNTFQIPSKDSETYFEAGLVKDGIDTYDLYIAIFTKEPLDMSRFEIGDKDLSSNESAYKFDELMEVMHSNKYASILLRTKTK